MALTLQQQDCRNSIIYFEMILSQLENGERPNAYDIHIFRKEVRKIKNAFEVKDETDHQTKNY